MYRLYIDDTGNADLKASQTDPNHRFLSLTGIIISLDYTREVATGRLGRTPEKGEEIPANLPEALPSLLL
jgi:hypothetical protein